MTTMTTTTMTKKMMTVMTTTTTTTDLDDRPVVGVGHLHGVLHCPGQRPRVYHTGPYVRTHIPMFTVWLHSGSMVTLNKRKGYKSEIGRRGKITF